eukprot:2428174-Prymnesium_polylepis.2
MCEVTGVTVRCQVRPPLRACALRLQPGTLSGSAGSQSGSPLLTRYVTGVRSDTRQGQQGQGTHAH